jgi:hypothetical protein
VSNLNDELRQIAADGAAKARPLSVADVIRRGNRRRARMIGQRSLSGLAVVGVGAAVIMTGVLHQARNPADSPTGHPASSAAHGVTAVAKTTTSSAGSITVGVKYRDEPRHRIKLLSITFAGKAKSAIPVGPTILISFTPAIPAGAAINMGCPAEKSYALGLPVRVSKNGAFAMSLSPKTISWIVPKGSALCGSQILQISLPGQSATLTGGVLLPR